VLWKPEAFHGAKVEAALARWQTWFEGQGRWWATRASEGWCLWQVKGVNSAIQGQRHRLKWDQWREPSAPSARQQATVRNGLIATRNPGAHL
jgi:hypothetical protein